MFKTKECEKERIFTSSFKGLRLGLLINLPKLLSHMVAINPTISFITLNMNYINSPIKGQILVEWI